jgi:uridine phosphorylase
MSRDVETTDERSEPLLTAAQRLAWRGGPLPRLPQAAVLTHQASLFRHFAPRFHRRRSPLAADVYVRPRSQGRVAMVGGLGVGAPATAIAVEELAVAGLRRIVAVDIGGSIDPSVASGDIVLVEGGLALDGTSPHYSSEVIVRASPVLTEALASALSRGGVPYTPGLVWSTDAPYRETPALIEAQRSQGAVLVDMETAALFAVAAALGIEAAAILVAADELFDGWRPPADMGAVQERLRRVAAIAAGSLQA